MEAFALKLIDFLVLSGTAGGWALFLLLFVVIVYYKHLKPFLLDWENLKANIIGENTIHQELKEILVEIKSLKETDIISVNKEFASLTHKLEDLNSLMDNISSSTDVIVSKHRKELYNEITKFNDIFRDMKTALDSHDKREDAKLQQLIIDLTKLATRIEMTQHVSALRGMQ